MSWSCKYTHYIQLVANGDKEGQLGSSIVRLPRTSEAQTQDIKIGKVPVMAHSTTDRFYKIENRIKIEVLIVVILNKR